MLTPLSLDRVIFSLWLHKRFSLDVYFIRTVGIIACVDKTWSWWVVPRFEIYCNALPQYTTQSVANYQNFILIMGNIYRNRASIMSSKCLLYFVLSWLNWNLIAQWSCTCVNIQFVASVLMFKLFIFKTKVQSFWSTITILTFQ